MWARSMNVNDVPYLYQHEANDLVKVEIAVEARYRISCCKKLIHKDDVKASQ